MVQLETQQPQAMHSVDDSITWRSRESGRMSAGSDRSRAAWK
jgi:hypothetical protein